MNTSGAEQGREVVRDRTTSYPVVTYSPGYLYCRVCGLELDGEEQLSAADVPTSWTLDDADAADFYKLDEDDDWR